MYLIFAIVFTAAVLAIAWRGFGARVDHRDDHEDSFAGPDRPDRDPTGWLPPRGRGQDRPGRVSAPDDDPEFLSEIDRRLRGQDKAD